MELVAWQSIKAQLRMAEPDTNAQTIFVGPIIKDSLTKFVGPYFQSVSL